MPNVAEGFSLRKGKVGSIPQFCWMNLQKETFNKGGKMKKCKSLLSLTIGLAIGLGFVGKVNGGTLHVGPTQNYATITLAVAAASANDTILVHPDTFNLTLEGSFPIVVNKSLTIQSTNGAGSTIIEGSFKIMADGDNFTLGGATGKGFTLESAPGEYLVWVDTGADSVTISYNTFDTEGNVDDAIRTYRAHGLTVTKNTFALTDQFDQGVRGHIGAGDVVTELTVSNNEFTSIGGSDTLETSGVEINEISILAFNSVITGNTFTNVGNGVLIGAPYANTGLVGGDSTLTISNNTFTDCNYGIDLVNATSSGVNQNIVIEQNTFTSNTEGLAINHGAAPYTDDLWQPEDFVVRYNNFTGNTYGIYNDADDLVPALTAKYNWWGNTTGPKQDLTNRHASGDAVSDSVLFVPWFASFYTTGDTDTTGGIPTKLLISASPTSIVVGGDSSDITATLTDVLGNPIFDTLLMVQSADSAYIDFSVTAGTDYGAVSPTRDTTDDWGHVTTKFKSLTKAGTSTVKGTWRHNSAVTATVDIKVIAGPLRRVETTPVDTHAVVVGDVNIVAELMDVYRNHIDATNTSEVGFTATGGSIGSKSVISGKIQMVYTTCDSLVPHTITATTETGSYTDISTVTTFGDAPKTMKLWADPDSSVVVSRGTNTLALHDTLFDQYGNKSIFSDYYASSNRFYKATFSVSPSGPTFSDTTPPVDTDGYCTTNYESDTLIGDYTVTATSGDATADVPITQTVDILAAVSLTPDSAWCAAGQDQTLKAELLDLYANHRNAADTNAVTFSIVSGLGALGARTLESDSTVSVIYTACDTAADTASIEAAKGGFTDTSIVINMAPGALHHFALAISPDTLTAGQEVTVTITAKDIADVRIYTYDNDDIIALTLDGTAAEASQVRWIIPTTPPDTVLALTASIPESLFTDGRVAFEVLNKKAETVTVTAVDIAEITGTTDTITWTPVDTLAHYGVVVQTDPIYGNFEFTITVNPCDKYGNVTTAELPRIINFQANETGVTLSGDPLPCDRTLEGPTDYTDMIADHATDSLVITVADYAIPAIIGCSDTITVGGERDVGPTIVLFPPDTVYIDSTYNVIVRCENFGDEGESPKVECIITGEDTAYVDTQYAILPFGGTDDVTFADWTVPPDAKGTFTITVVTLLSSDVNPGNDTLIAQIVSRAYGVEEDRVPMPTRFEFLSIFPNPVSCHAKITYAIPVKSRIDMKIYDITGKLVTTLKNGVIEEPGYKVANWNMTDARGKKVNSGIYFCNLEMNKESSTKKILVIK